MADKGPEDTRDGKNGVKGKSDWGKLSCLEILLSGRKGKARDVVWRLRKFARSSVKALQGCTDDKFG